MTLRNVVLILVFAVLSACATTTEIKPGNLKKAAEYNADLGSQYLAAGNLKKAQAKLVKALQQDDSNARANFNYARLLARITKNDDAETHFQKAVALAPDETHYQDAFGIFLCGLGRYKDAKKQFLLAANNPFNEHPEFAFNNAGSCAMSLGDLEQAQHNAREALRKNPRFTPALLNLAEISLDLEKIKIADAYYSRYLKFGKHTADSLWLGVQIKRLTGERNQVDKYGFLLKRDFPQSQQTLLYLESRQ